MMERLIEEGANINSTNKYKNTPLHIAALKGNNELAKILIKKGANYKTQNKYYFTPLHLAAANGYENIVKLLINKEKSDDKFASLISLKKKSYVNVGGKDGDTALHLAIKNDWGYVVVSLLDYAQTNINASNASGKSPLHIAVMNERSRLVKILLAKGALTDFEDIGGRTPLHYASRKGNEEIAKILLESGAHINRADEMGQTPLHFAAILGNAKLVELLLKKEAILEACNAVRQTPLHLAAAKGCTEVVKKLVEDSASLEVRDSQGRTPFLIAVEKGKETIVTELINKGADIEVCDRGKNSALHLAAVNNRLSLVISLLAETSHLNSKNKKGETPLYLAIKFKNIDVVSKILTYGVNSNLYVEKEKALHKAVVKGNKEIVKELLDYGAYIDAVDSKRRTPLILAIVKLNNNGVKSSLKRRVDIQVANVNQNVLSIVKLLLKRRANVQITDENQHTPLHHVASLGNVNLAKLLICYGINIEAKDKKEYTALHIAVINNNVGLTSLLLQEGANPSVFDMHHMTPLHYAAEIGRPKILKLLLKYGSDIEANGPYGATPLTLSINKTKWDNINLLINYGANIFHVDSKGDSLERIFIEKLNSDVAYNKERKKRLEKVWVPQSIFKMQEIIPPFNPSDKQYIIKRLEEYIKRLGVPKGWGVYLKKTCPKGGDLYYLKKWFKEIELEVKKSWADFELTYSAIIGDLVYHVLSESFLSPYPYQMLLKQFLAITKEIVEPADDSINEDNSVGIAEKIMNMFGEKDSKLRALKEPYDIIKRTLQAYKEFNYLIPSNLFYTLSSKTDRKALIQVFARYPGCFYNLEACIFKYFENHIFNKEDKAKLMEFRCLVLEGIRNHTFERRTDIKIIKSEVEPNSTSYIKNESCLGLSI
jgi:ankyrin repeat protein